MFHFNANSLNSAIYLIDNLIALYYKIYTKRFFKKKVFFTSKNNILLALFDALYLL